MSGNEVEKLEEGCRVILAEIAPGSHYTGLRPMGNDGTHPAYVLEARQRSGAEIRFAVKCYRADVGPASRRARQEFQALRLLQHYDVPVPEPFFLDEQGVMLGAPAIVTGFVNGKQMLTSPNGLTCARELAKTLAKIHSIPIGPEEMAELQDAEPEILWYRQPGTIPAYVAAHPDGEVVWRAIEELLQRRETVAPVLMHIDYWMGNVLWEQDRIVAVVDWEEASYGDPAYDLAYCRMDMFLSRMGPAAADELLRVYEAEMGRPAANLELWEFAVTPRPMYSPDWEAACRQEMRDFIADVRRRTGY